MLDTISHRISKTDALLLFSTKFPSSRLVFLSTNETLIDLCLCSLVVLFWTNRTSSSSRMTRMGGLTEIERVTKGYTVCMNVLGIYTGFNQPPFLSKKITFLKCYCLVMFIWHVFAMYRNHYKIPYTGDLFWIVKKVNNISMMVETFGWFCVLNLGSRYFARFVRKIQEISGDCVLVYGGTSSVWSASCV